MHKVFIIDIPEMPGMVYTNVLGKDSIGMMDRAFAEDWYKRKTDKKYRQRMEREEAELNAAMIKSRIETLSDPDFDDII
jgi:hypothetical protein